MRDTIFKIFIIRMVRLGLFERHYFQDFVDKWLGLVRLRTLFSKYFINMIRFSQVERGYVQNIYN